MGSDLSLKDKDNHRMGSVKVEEERKPPGAICHLGVSVFKVGFEKTVKIGGQQLISAKIMNGRRAFTN